jgi:hypothetical protein
MNVVFLTRELDYGGAQRQLVALAKGLHARGHRVVVALFYSGGPLEQELRNGRIRPLQKRGRWICCLPVPTRPGHAGGASTSCMVISPIL